MNPGIIYPLECNPNCWVCKPAYLVPIPSQDKLGGLWQNGGDDGGGAPISLDGVASSWIVGASAFIIFPLLNTTEKPACKNTIVGYHPVGVPTCLCKQEVGKLSQNAAQLCAQANNPIFVTSALLGVTCIVCAGEVYDFVNLLCHLSKCCFKWF